MKPSTLERKVLDKKVEKKTKKKKLSLVDEAISELNSRVENEYMPYFILNPEDKTNNVFAHLFIAKHCRNAYAGLFIRLEPEKGTPLTPKEKNWINKFRTKGYGCTVINTVPQFKNCIEAYKHTAGTMGYNHFYSTYERKYS